MPNEIRNMSQWWFENKIGLECQTFGKIEGDMRGCWIEQKFCICGPDRKFGPARPRPARHYTTFPSGCQQVIYTKISFDFGENVFGKNAQKIRLNRAGFRRFCVLLL